MQLRSSRNPTNIRNPLIYCVNRYFLIFGVSQVQKPYRASTNSFLTLGHWYHIIKYKSIGNFKWEIAGAFFCLSDIYYQERQMSGGGKMREKTGHLVMWAEIMILVVLCVQLVFWGNNNEKWIEAVAKENFPEKNPVEKKKVALTFDDGPSSKYTPLLLEGLKARGVHATFFLMGKNIPGKEALVKQMQEDGHLIGNHTYNHVELNKISREAAKEEIETVNQEIYEITGVYPVWLRPPYGEWQKNLDFYVEMFPVLWDVDTLDWKSKNVEAILSIVKSEVKDQAVILMHDSYQSSVEAALRLIDMLRAEEYEFVTVEELVLP